MLSVRFTHFSCGHDIHLEFINDHDHSSLPMNLYLLTLSSSLPPITFEHIYTFVLQSLLVLLLKPLCLFVDLFVFFFILVFVVLVCFFFLLFFFVGEKKKKFNLIFENEEFHRMYKASF